MYTKGKCNHLYHEELQRQLHSYKTWIEQEKIKQENLRKNHKPISTIGYKIFITNKGRLHEAIDLYLEQAFLDEDVMLVYGDEDGIDAYNQRSNPWFKPKWSPDTFASHFYFGSVLAIRDSYVKEWQEKINVIDRKEGYALCINLINELCQKGKSLEKSIYHSANILFHYEVEPAMIMPEEVQGLVEEKKLLYAHVEKEKLTQCKVSIIIPSKDNAEILGNCIRSIKQFTKEVCYEVLVIDNGSRLEEKEKLIEMSNQYGFQYTYEPMEFNFAKMCNQGVKKSQGNFILLLNDDVELVEENWLSKMLLVAVREHVGAVGIKLLYPKTKKIQHVGVTNIEVGPVHKLIGESDELIHYYGTNRGQWNKVAVTGACLLVKRSAYEEVEGLCEELAVAYNDVDFCFRLLEKGYYHVVCNDIYGLHHESFSRGNDLVEEKKNIRLKKEQDLLYQRNPRYKNGDPYYSIHLIQDASYYECVSMLPCERLEYFQEPIHKGKRKWIGRNKIHPFYYIEKLTNENGIVEIRGWSFLNEVDNACYETQVLFQNDKGKIWSFYVYPKYRKDVSLLVENQVNNALAGIKVRFKEEILPEGNYELLLRKKNKITKEIQYVATGKKIECKSCVR